MPANPTKIPLMRRLSIALKDHGLSLGDALNIALFLLTVFSLFFAYEGVRIARITLTEAHNAAEDQEKEFKQQIDELTKSSQALETARNLLATESDALQSLQRNSQKAEARIARLEKARPAPHVEAYCASEEFIDASGTQLSQAIIKRKVKMFIPLEKSDEIPCQVRLTNDGDGELRNTTLQLHFSCIDHPEIGIKKSSEPTQTPYSPDATFFKGSNVPPAPASDRILIEEFALLRAASCANIEVNGVFESDNFHSAYFLSQIEVQNPR